MPITWTDTIRKAMSRRLVKLPQELVVFDIAVTNVTDSETAFINVDTSNDELLSYWIDVCDAYLEERELLSGETYETFSLADAQASIPYPDALNPKTYGAPPAQDLFFPSGTNPPDVDDNMYLIPKITEYCDGTSTGTATSYEEAHANAHSKIIEALVSGLGGGGGAITTHADVAYAGGTTLNVHDATGISIGSILFLWDTTAATTGNYIVYVSGVDPVDPTLFTVVKIAGSGTIDIGEAVCVRSAGVVWDAGDKEAFPCTGTGPGAFANSGLMATLIDNYCRTGGEWDANLVLQRTQLVANEDKNYTTDRSAETASIDATRAAISAWIANGAAGATCMWTDAKLAIFDTSVSARISQISTRKAQLITALGSVVAGLPPSTFTTTSGAIASRYVALDRKLNKGYGSAAQAGNMTTTKGYVQQQYDSASITKADYSSFMSAVPLVEEPDGTNVIYINMDFFDSPTSYTAFEAGDNVYLWDETSGNSELYGKVLMVHDDGRVDLNFVVPTTYTTDNLARIYKILP